MTSTTCYGATNPQKKSHHRMHCDPPTGVLEIHIHPIPEVATDARMGTNQRGVDRRHVGCWLASFRHSAVFFLAPRWKTSTDNMQLPCRHLLGPPRPSPASGTFPRTRHGGFRHPSSELVRLVSERWDEGLPDVSRPSNHSYLGQCMTAKPSSRERYSGSTIADPASVVEHGRTYHGYR